MDSIFASFYLDILITTKQRIPPPSTAEIYVEQRNKFWGVMVGGVAIEQATLDRECNVALAKWNVGIVACNGKEKINPSEAFLD